MVWILFIIGACIAWGISEILSDVCIEQTKPEEESETLPDNPQAHALKKKLRRRQESGSFEGLTDMNPIFSNSTPFPHEGYSSGKLTGEQSAIVSGVTMLMCVMTMHLVTSNAALAWDTSLWWLSAIAGVLNGFAYILLFKAYETAPSTVIIPLMQLTAIMMLITSTVVALIAPYFPSLLSVEENDFLTMRECIAYVIILVGALYPAAQGNFSQFLLPTFWNQPYVIFILCNDFLVAIVYECMGIATSEHLGGTPEQFIIVSSYASALTMISVFLFNERMRRHVVSLKFVRSKYMCICVVSEVLNWAAYWFATYAYKCHEANISIVGAAEVALNQVVNLAIALLMKVTVDVGRDSAIEGLPSKLLSCLFITAGIIFTSFNGKPMHKPTPRQAIGGLLNSTVGFITPSDSLPTF